MGYLVLVSLLWAFSFGLIGDQLTGLDPYFVAWARLSLALPLFLPFLRLRGLSGRSLLLLGFVGAVQFGVMYVLYLYSFRYLPSWQVALFTIFTPIYVILMAEGWKRRLPGARVWLAAFLAVAGAGVLLFRPTDELPAWTGFLLMQASNLCFAFGQVAWVRLRGRNATQPDARVFAVLYLGAWLVTGVVCTVAGGWSSLPAATLSQWGVLIYLGTLSTGLGFFWWNHGARKVSAGLLGVMNNLKVPLAVAVSLVVFGESADPLRLTVSLLLTGLAVVLVWRRGG